MGQMKLKENIIMIPKVSTNSNFEHTNQIFFWLLLKWMKHEKLLLMKNSLKINNSHFAISLIGPRKVAVTNKILTFDQS